MTTARKKKAVHNPELFRADGAEKQILGVMLGKEETAVDLCSRLEPYHFADGPHRRMFVGLKATIEAGYPPKIPLIAQRVEPSSDDNEGSDVPAYLQALKFEADGVQDVSDFVDQIMTTGARRRAREIMEEGLQQISVVGVDDDPVSVAEGVSERLMEVRTRSAPTDRFREALYGNLSESGLDTGFQPLDTLVAPLMPGQVIVVAARPKIGKSLLLSKICIGLAQQGHAVGFLSLELTPNEIKIRHISHLAGVNTRILTDRRHERTDAETEALANAEVDLSRLPIHLEGGSKWGIGRIRGWATRLKRAHGVKALIIDQLTWVNVERAKDKHERLGMAISQLKEIAQDLEIPIVVAHQLNREADTVEYTGHGSVLRPTSRHLLGSDDILQTADAVILIHRPWINLGRVRPSRDAKDKKGQDLYPKWELDRIKSEGLAILICDARRNGPDGSQNCSFNDSLAWFEEHKRRTDDETPPTQSGML